MRRNARVVAPILLTALWMGGTPANADCSVETRQAAGKYFRVITCDESDQVISDAMARASESCVTPTGEVDYECKKAVAESFEMRRESMLRRALKEGASVKAAAELYGYTEKEVERWIAANTPTNRGYPEPVEIPADVLEAQEGLDNVLRQTR